MKPSILCVDDDRHLCNILSRALKGEGYAVRAAYDGDEALTALEREAPDLVLLDLLLPRRDGFSVLESMRQLDGPVAQAPVLLISGCSQTPEYRERAEQLGAAEFMTKPVPLALLLERVAKHLGTAAPAPAASAGEPARRGRTEPAAPRTAPLRGSLAEQRFPALLHSLHGLRASGVLHLASGKRRKAIQLRDGYPVAVKSNLVNECLGNYLVRTGRIPKQALDESLRRMKRGEGLQGEILVAMELLSEHELTAALRAQAREKLFELFEWTDGVYELRGGRLERANAIALEGSPANVILEGVCRRFPLAEIDAFMRQNAARAPVPSENPFYRFQEIHLEVEHQELLTRLDGSLRLGELLEADAASRRTVFALLTAEMLVLEGNAPPAAAAPLRSEPQVPAPEDAKLRAELASTAERLRGRSFFEILEVSESDDADVVREAYVQLAKRMHPDRYSAASAAAKQLAAEIFRLVSDAYETLSDDKRRTEYLLNLRRGARERAEIEEGQRALQAELQFQQGEVRLRKRDFLGALECFHQATRIYPEEGEYHAYQGWALYLSRPEELTEAIEIIKYGAKLAPDREKPYLFLGHLSKAQRRIKLAERYFTRVVQINPDCVEALRELRLINMRREKEKGLIRRLIRR